VAVSLVAASVPFQAPYILTIFRISKDLPEKNVLAPAGLTTVMKRDFVLRDRAVYAQINGMVENWDQSDVQMTGGAANEENCGFRNVGSDQEPAVGV
jgi:hypothetical protein